MTQLNNWVENGLALTNMQIVSNADNQSLTIDSHGLLAREYLPITDTYSPEQLKVINKGLYVTDDDWLTSRAGIGKFKYYDPETGKMVDAYGVIADTLVGNLVLSEKVGVYTESGNIKLDQNGIAIETESAVEDAVPVFLIRRKNEDGTYSDIMYVDSSGYL